MHNSLFMICPTDYIESVIRNRFDGKKYFYTSLGNTLTLDKSILSQIAEVIQKHDIKEIIFILSEENSIIKDALYKQSFSTIKGLKESYDLIQGHKNQSLDIWQSNNTHFRLLSYFLNHKIEELQFALSNIISDQIIINGKLYSNDNDCFRYIYPSFMTTNSSLLN